MKLGKIVYEVDGYSVFDDGSEKLGEKLDICAYSYDLDKAKLLANYAVQRFGCARAEVTFRDEDGEEQYAYEILPLGKCVVRDGYELHFMPDMHHLIPIASVPLRYCFSGSLTNPKCCDCSDDIPF